MVGHSRHLFLYVSFKTVEKDRTIFFGIVIFSHLSGSLHGRLIDSQYWDIRLQQPVIAGNDSYSINNLVQAKPPSGMWNWNPVTDDSMAVTDHKYENWLEAGNVITVYAIAF